MLLAMEVCPSAPSVVFPCKLRYNLKYERSISGSIVCQKAIERYQLTIVPSAESRPSLGLHEFNFDEYVKG